MFAYFAYSLLSSMCREFLHIPLAYFQLVYKVLDLVVKFKYVLVLLQAIGAIFISMFSVKASCQLKTVILYCMPNLLLDGNAFSSPIPNFLQDGNTFLFPNMYHLNLWIYRIPWIHELTWYAVQWDPTCIVRCCHLVRVFFLPSYVDMLRD